MIELTSLNGTNFFLNPHEIETMEAKPDTTLFLLSGKRIVVRESTAEVIDRIVAYRRKLGIINSQD